MSTPSASAIRRLVAVTVVVVAAVVVLGGPVLGYFSERRDVSAQREELAQLEAENRELADRLASFEDPARLERIAREEYGLVAPGQEAYAVLPRATAGVDLPRAWPFEPLAGSIAAASASP